MDISVILIVFVTLVFAYPVLKMVLLQRTEPLRLEFADLGRKLLTDPAISEDHKIFISDMLDDVFSWQFMAKASYLFPVAIFMRGREAHLTGEDKKFFDRQDVERFFTLHMRAVMAASPFWAFVFLLVVTATAFIIIVWLGSSALSYLWFDTVKHVSPTVHQNGQNTHFLPG